MIKIDDFKKVEMKVGEILSVQHVPNTDKLYVLNVDIGGKQIQLVAGLRPYYTEDELIGKKIVVVTNLQPVNIRGITSEGMLLAAVKDDEVTLLTVDKDIPVGADIA